MDDQTASEIREDFNVIDLPGLIHHPDGTKDFQPRWTGWQVATARELKARGLTHREIGRRIGKNRIEVGNKLRQLRRQQ